MDGSLAFLLVFSPNYCRLMNLNIQQEEALLLTYEEGLRQQEVRVSPERVVSDKVSIYNRSKKSKEPLEICACSNTVANEVALKRLARSVFEQQRPESMSEVTFKILW